MKFERTKDAFIFRNIIAFQDVARDESMEVATTILRSVAASKLIGDFKGEWLYYTLLNFTKSELRRLYKALCEVQNWGFWP